MRTLHERPTEVIEILDSDEESAIELKEVVSSSRDDMIKKVIMAKDYDNFKFYFFSSLLPDGMVPEKRYSAIREKYIQYFKDKVGIDISRDNFRPRYEQRIPEEVNEQPQLEEKPENQGQQNAQNGQASKEEQIDGQLHQDREKNGAINQRHIIVHGVDLLNTQRIEAFFKGNDPLTIKWINPSNVSIKFTEQEDVKQLMEIVKLYSKNEKQSAIDQESEPQLWEKQWIELKPYNELNFDRRWFFRYASADEADIEKEPSEVFEKLQQARFDIQNCSMFLKTKEEKHKYDEELNKFTDNLSDHHRRHRRRQRSLSQRAESLSKASENGRFRSREKYNTRRSEFGRNDGRGSHYNGRATQRYSRSPNSVARDRSEDGNRRGFSKKQNYGVGNSRQYNNDGSATDRPFRGRNYNENRQSEWDSGRQNNFQRQSKKETQKFDWNNVSFQRDEDNANNISTRTRRRSVNSNRSNSSIASGERQARVEEIMNDEGGAGSKYKDLSFVVQNNRSDLLNDSRASQYGKQDLSFVLDKVENDSSKTQDNKLDLTFQREGGDISLDLDSSRINSHLNMTFERGQEKDQKSSSRRAVGRGGFSGRNDRSNHQYMQVRDRNRCHDDSDDKNNEERESEFWKHHQDTNNKVQEDDEIEY